VEEEVGNKINFLDITISKDVYRTAADIIIPNDSCHLLEHTLVAIRYLPNRLSTYPMNETKKKRE
jgi:hypothetical protein